MENNNIKYSFVPKEKFKKFENKNHQGAVAILSPIKLLSIEELISVTFNKISSKTYVLLDGITDARNFGAIIRTARVNNIKDAILHLNSIEINIISLSEKANKTIYDYNFKDSTAIIMGSEEKGISKGVLSLSNEILKIPIDSKIDSLNVSSAFSAVAFEIIRQRNF